jgi:hypothetical protein
MRWKLKPKPSPQLWREWFAWFPVEIDGEKVYLEWVERYWEYRGDYIAVDYRHAPTAKPE